MNKDKLFKILCIISFVLVAVTSIPLFIKYLTGSPAGSRLIIDLHVWFGIAFIVFALIRIIKFRGLKK